MQKTDRIRKTSRHCAELGSGHKVELQIVVHLPKDKCTMKLEDAYDAAQKLMANLLLDVACELTNADEILG